MNFRKAAVFNVSYVCNQALSLVEVGKEFLYRDTHYCHYLGRVGTTEDPRMQKATSGMRLRNKGAAQNARIL